MNDQEILQKTKDLLLEDDSIEKLEEAQKKIEGFLNELRHFILKSSGVDGDIDKIHRELQDFMKKFYEVQTLLLNSRNESCKKIKEFETKYVQLKIKWQEEKKKVQDLENSNKESSQEYLHLSKFTTKMGSVISNFLWISSKVRQMVKKWLTEDPKKIGELFDITSTVLTSFISFFDAEFPESDCDDFNLVKSLLGAITNVSSVAEGRNLMVTHPDGQKLITQIIQVFHTIPTVSSGIIMKILLMSILYNVSLVASGLPFIIEKKVYEVIPACLDDSPELNEKLQTKALLLLRSLTYDLKDFVILDKILSSIPRERIEQLIQSKNEKIAESAKEIIENIRKCYAHADTISVVSSKKTAERY